MIDLASQRLSLAPLPAWGGSLTAGWWVTVRMQSRTHELVLESRERAQRSDTLATTLHERVTQQYRSWGNCVTRWQMLRWGERGRKHGWRRSRSLDEQKALFAQARPGTPRLL